MTTERRILKQITKHDGVTSIGLVASDLRLSCDTVRKHVQRLITDGHVEYGWDGQALSLTSAERQQNQQIRPLDALVSRLKEV